MPLTNKDRERIAAVRRSRVLELRKFGATYQQVLEQLREEIPDELPASYDIRHVAQDVRRVFDHQKAILAETAEDYRALDLIRLEEMFSRLYPKALGNEVVPGDEATVRTIIRIMERKSKYLGLDAPEKIDVRNLTDDELIARASAIISGAGSTGTDTPKNE